MRNRPLVSSRPVALLVACSLTAASLTAYAAPKGPKPKAPPAASAPAPAPAAPVVDNAALAEELKKKGDAAFDERRYAEAAEAYDKGYELSQKPSFLYNGGRAYEALNRYPEALDRFEAFAEKADPALRAKVPGFDGLLAETRKRVAIVVIEPNIASSRLLLRGVSMGEVGSSHTYKVNAGKAALEISADGYYPYVKEMDLKGGETTPLKIELLPRSTSGELVVKANVAGATLMVDGQKAGNPPVELVLPAGPHKLLATKDGYEPSNASVVVTAGQRREFTVNLAQTPSVFTRWWFWTSVAVVVAGGAVMTYALLTEKAAAQGTLSPGQIAAPLLSF